MNIFENSFARMPGPLFLAFYFVLSITVVLLVKYAAPKIIGLVKEDDGLKLSEQPDPYEIAFIRGGQTEILFLTIYNLVKRGYLSLHVNSKKTKVNIHRKIREATGTMTNCEKLVFDAVDKEQKLNTFVDKMKDDAFLKAMCKNLEKKLADEQYIWSENQQGKFALIQFVAVLFMVGVGVYKITAAIIHGHSNIFFLIILIIAACFFIINISTELRPTSKGEKTLKQLKSTFTFIQGNKLQEQPLYLQQILIATYGFILLQYSNFGFLHDYFHDILHPPKELNYAESSGGSGCGGGGGGCGGGCGGCGGCS